MVVFSLLYQFDKSGENTLLVHHIECDFILPAVKEQERDGKMEGIGGVFL